MCRLETWDVTVRVEGRDHDVGEPEADQDGGGRVLVLGRAAELAANEVLPAEHDQHDGEESQAAEDCHRQSLG